MPPKNPDLDNFASVWNGMLRAELGANRARQEEKYVNALVGKPMNRKQRRENLKVKSKKRG
jgi:hypothetical protein